MGHITNFQCCFSEKLFGTPSICDMSFINKHERLIISLILNHIENNRNNLTDCLSLGDSYSARNNEPSLGEDLSFLWSFIGHLLWDGGGRSSWLLSQCERGLMHESVSC